MGSICIICQKRTDRKFNIDDDVKDLYFCNDHKGTTKTAFLLIMQGDVKSGERLLKTARENYIRQQRSSET
jgi:hypothetical protein